MGHIRITPHQYPLNTFESLFLDFWHRWFTYSDIEKPVAIVRAFINFLTRDTKCSTNNLTHGLLRFLLCNISTYMKLYIGTYLYFTIKHLKALFKSFILQIILKHLTSFLIFGKSMHRHRQNGDPMPSQCVHSRKWMIQLNQFKNECLISDNVEVHQHGEWRLL